MLTLGNFQTIINSHEFKSQKGTQTIKGFAANYTSGEHGNQDLKNILSELNNSEKSVRRQFMSAVIHDLSVNKETMNKVKKVLERAQASDPGSRMTRSELSLAFGSLFQKQPKPLKHRDSMPPFENNKKAVQRNVNPGGESVKGRRDEMAFRASGKSFDKYSKMTECDHYRFGKGETSCRQALINLRKSYHDHQRNIPGFLHHRYVVDLSDPSKPVDAVALRSLRENPELFSFHTHKKSGASYTIEPNTPYVDLQQLADPKIQGSLKHQDGGITYISWFIDDSVTTGENSTSTPDNRINLLNIRDYAERAGIINKVLENRERYESKQASELVDLRRRSDYAGAPVQKPPKSVGLERRDSQKIISDLPDKGEAYIATILDLNKKHLPLLREMKANAENKMAELFGYNKEHDDLRMYFHFPYGDATTTLHLHIRLNQGHTELEDARSFQLDDIINHLENNDDIYGLIEERQQSPMGIRLDTHFRNDLAMQAFLREHEKEVTITSVDLIAEREAEHEELLNKF